MKVINFLILRDKTLSDIFQTSSFINSFIHSFLLCPLTWLLIPFSSLSLHWFYFSLFSFFFYSCSGLIQLRDLLSLSLDIDILIKAVDSASYHAILQELKDKEIYNMIVDIHKTDNMADFLKAVSDFIFLFSFLFMPFDQDLMLNLSPME